MPSVSKPTSRRRRNTKAETRERLLKSALKLLESGGEAAVTTISVTRGAGIGQSAFYIHFSNVEECLAIVAERTTDEIREVVATARRGRLEAAPHGEKELEAIYSDLLTLVSRTKSIHRLLLRYRSDRLAFNGVMYRFARGLSEDLEEHLTQQAVQLGCKAPPADWIAAVADHLVAVSLAAIEAHLDRRGPPPDVSARLLAVVSDGLWKAALNEMKKGQDRKMSKGR
jgi:AcrR family transcriptional regulator